MPRATKAVTKSQDSESAGSLSEMQRRLTNYIRAGYPGLYLVSPEEHRVEAELKAVAMTVGFGLHCWSATTGLVDTDISHGIEVIHEDGLVVWRIRGLRPRRVAVFEREQYRQEILSKVRAALDAWKAMGPHARFGIAYDPEQVHAALYYAEKAIWPKHAR